VTDITYMPTGEGWLYLTVILDLCSRVVVGSAMSERITRELTLNALDMALVQRRPGHGLLHHSDRGSTPVATTSRRSPLNASCAA
jgi:putative transposase